MLSHPYLLRLAFRDTHGWYSITLGLLLLFTLYVLRKILFINYDYVHKLLIHAIAEGARNTDIHIALHKGRASPLALRYNSA